MAYFEDIEQVCRKGLEKGKIEKIVDSELGEYLRFRDEIKKYMRGTVVIGSKIILGYPHIERIFHLENGIKKNLSEFPEIFVEEKIDGFNVRIAKINGKIYGFSRGGFCEKFLVEKARDIKSLEKFFVDYPNYIICGEMIGETPHTKVEDRYVQKDNMNNEIQFFVFDIMKENSEFIPAIEKYKILKKYKIQGTPFLGKFQTGMFDELKRLILKVNSEQKEGIVMKAPSGDRAIKFVTANSDLGDIKDGSKKFFDMPIGFFYQRILRIALFAEQFGLNDIFNKKLGDSFLIGLKEAIEEVKAGKEISEAFSISVNDVDIWNDIKKHMDKDVKLVEKAKTKQNGKTKISYEKVYKNTDKTLKAYLNGKAISD